MPDLPDPPRKTYRLGARNFERVNAPPAAIPPSGSAALPEPARPAAGTAPPLFAHASPRHDNDVHAILRENLDRANAAGLNDLAPQPPRRSRRRRDYWLLLIGGNLFFGLIALHTGPAAPIPFVSALAGMAILNVALTWVMWFVMDNY